jgi:SAM-dependent methyltransferase
MNERVSDWASFWAQPNSIYVSERHSDAHCRDVADGIIALLPAQPARVLDFGCGEEKHAARIAAVTSELLLCDASPSVREKLQRRFSGQAKIKVLTPEDAERRPAASLDFVVANSVVQYFSKTELDRLLGVWRRLLVPGGTLVIGDVIPPQVGTLSDAAALLRYAAKNGFLIAALIGIGRNAVSPYRKLRAELGVTRYSEAEFLAILDAAGFSAQRLGVNLEHNPARMTFRAKPR